MKGTHHHWVARWQAKAPAPLRRIDILPGKVGQALSPANAYRGAIPKTVKHPS